MREAFALIPKDDQKHVSSAFLSAHHPDGVFDVEHRINHQSSGELRWVHSKGHGVFDDDGKLLCIVGTNRDITDRRRAELAFVDTARTFRTLTQASPGLVFRTDQQGQATFFNVDRWVDFSGLGRDAWRGQGWFAAFHPDCRDQARDDWQATISARAEFHGEYRWVHVDDETDLKQLLTNLIVNSRDAMPSGGLLQVNLTKEGDAHLALEVVDTGIGMSADVSSRIFEPFFSTKEQGQGTGLGLAVAHGTVVSHGGRVYVDSQLGQGTKIKVVLPICEPKVDEINTQALFKGASQPCRILLVEDNDLVRESAMLRIESDGYEVAGFRSGEEGIASLQRDTAFDVAVLDVDLPGIDGVDTATGLREIKPGLPVIFVTGNTQNESLNKARSNDPVISKPIEFETFLQVVDGVNSRVAAG